MELATLIQRQVSGVANNKMITAQEARNNTREFNRKEILEGIKERSSKGYYSFYSEVFPDQEFVDELVMAGYEVFEKNILGVTYTVIRW